MPLHRNIILKSVNTCWVVEVEYFVMLQPLSVTGIVPDWNGWLHGILCILKTYFFPRFLENQRVCMVAWQNIIFVIIWCSLKASVEENSSLMNVFKCWWCISFRVSSLALHPCRFWSSWNVLSVAGLCCHCHWRNNCSAGVILKWIFTL